MDYMIKILPNNRILVRNKALGTSEVLKARELSKYFEKVLEEQIKAQDEEDGKVSEIGGILNGMGVRK